MSGRAAALALLVTAAAAPLLASEAGGISGARLEDGAGLSPAAALARVGRQVETEWVGWSVTGIAASGDACCCGEHGERRGCSLADDRPRWTTGDGEHPTGAMELEVLVAVRSAQVQRMRWFTNRCPVDGAGRRLLWLGAVDAGASLETLARLVRDRDGSREVHDGALAAAAYHADPRADDLLATIAGDRALDREARKQAIFWSGSLRGAAGLRLLERVLDGESDAELRDQALFALAQDRSPAALARLRRAASEDSSPHARGQALFWLAQSNAPGAGSWIVSRLDVERDPRVREQAVFALSQLADGTDWLLQLLHSRRDREVVRQAFFWLAQSNDPRALAELAKVFER